MADEERAMSVSVKPNLVNVFVSHSGNMDIPLDRAAAWRFWSICTVESGFSTVGFSRLDVC